MILRICHPEDEDDTKTDYIFPLMTSEERWLWLNTSDVIPYYIDCDSGSKSRMFQEGFITVDPFTADYAHFLTKFMFRYYEKFLGVPLFGPNLSHFENATAFHYQALQSLQTQKDINEYIVLICEAIDEYQSINI